MSYAHQVGPGSKPRCAFAEGAALVSFLNPVLYPRNRTLQLWSPIVVLLPLPAALQVPVPRPFAPKPVSDYKLAVLDALRTQYSHRRDWNNLLLPGTLHGALWNDRIQEKNTQTAKGTHTMVPGCLQKLNVCTPAEPSDPTKSGLTGLRNCFSYYLGVQLS